MNTSLDHLPPPKREQILALAALLRAEVAAELIILFGSYARGDWVEDPETGYASDYDLLIVVARASIANDGLISQDLWQRLRALAGGVPVSVIVHDVKQINQDIRAGHYFFIDIVREGIVLYDSKGFALAKPKVLGKAERLTLARTHFGKWFESASGFFRIAGHCMGQGLLPHAAFLLHQTAERYFHAALLVFTGYKPRTHDLELLATQTAPLHPALAGALPRIDQEDERLFVALRKAYIDARYTMNYYIALSDLEALRTRTLDLGARVREACMDQLRVLGAEASELGQGVPLLPSAEDVGELGEEPPIASPEGLRAWMSARNAASFERGEREGLARGKAEGKAEGIAEGMARAVIAILEARALPVSAKQRAAIEGCTDEEQLGRWITHATTAASTDELMGPRTSQ